MKIGCCLSHTYVSFTGDLSCDLLQAISKVVLTGSARICEIYCRGYLEKEASYIGTVRGVPCSGALFDCYMLEIPFQVHWLQHC